MYNRSTVRSSSGDITTFIEGYDIFNSKLINLLSQVQERELYEVTNYEYRPDKICRDLYGSEDYLTVFLIVSGKVVEEFKKGEVIQYIRKDIIDSLLDSCL